MGNVAKQPKTQVSYIQQYMKNGVQISCASMQGWRQYMEDYYCVGQPTPDTILAGVFDGHGGPQVACFVSRILIQQLRKQSQFQKGNHYKGLVDCFKSIDERIKSQDGDEQLMAIQKQLNGSQSLDRFDLRREVGSTANVVLLTDQKIYLANIGDSRAVLCRNGIAIPLSHDHKPQNQIEKDRIIRAGGRIINNRINSSLNISRTFGDFNFKMNRKKSFSEQMVISIPQICQLQRKKQEDQYILIASDGVWQKYQQNNQKLINQLNQIFARASNWQQSLQTFLHSLIPSTYQQHLTGYDNMTIALILLDVSRKSKIQQGSDTTITIQ